MSALLAPGMRDALNHDPRPVLAELRTPVLVINGDKDLQVDAGRSLAAVRAALEQAANPDFEIHLLPGLNHLLQPAATGLPSEYSEIEVTISPLVLNRMSAWIAERFVDARG